MATELEEADLVRLVSDDVAKVARRIEVLNAMGDQEVHNIAKVILIEALEHEQVFWCRQRRAELRSMILSGSL